MIIEAFDEVVLDYIGYTDMGEFDDGMNVTIVVDSHSPLIGMMLGDEKDVDYVFSKDYEIDYLRAKCVTYHVTIKEIHKR